MRDHINEVESWDESIGPIQTIDDYLERPGYFCEIAFGTLLIYLLRRNAIPNGRYFRPSELVSAFGENGIDASGLLTVPVRKYIIHNQFREICGKKILIKNTPNGIKTIHVDGMILHHKICRIRASDWVACFMKALEMEKEMSLTVCGIVMAEKIIWQTKKKGMKS